jgi:hypothetical protein
MIAGQARRGTTLVEPAAGQDQPTPPRGVSVTGVSVTGRLEPHGWSNEETAAYEAAIEAINGAVGAYSALIAAQERRAEPDQRVVDTARAAQSALAREREQLRSTDHDQLAEVRARCAQLSREILARLG